MEAIIDSEGVHIFATHSKISETHAVGCKEEQIRWIKGTLEYQLAKVFRLVPVAIYSLHYILFPGSFIGNNYDRGASWCD